MAPITLEALKVKHKRLNRMISKLAGNIAAFERQAAGITTYRCPEVTLLLSPGERYAGIITKKPDEAAHHLILLPGDEQLTWKAATDWAASFGGALANRREQTTDRDSGAWGQHFGSVGQDYSHKGSQLRARAVRRIFL